MKKVLFVPAMALLALVYFASCKPVVVTPTEPSAPTEPTNPTVPTAPSTPEEPTVPNKPTVTFTVIFDSDGGSDVESQTVTSGDTATIPNEPTKTAERTSYAFLGWYNGNDKYDFSTEVKTDITLKAKWLEGFVKVESMTVNGAVGDSQVFIAGRSVEIHDIFVCEHEVTQGEYETYCKYGSYSPSDTYGKEENFPAYNVNWYDAVIYCNLRTIAELGIEYCVYSLNGENNPANWAGIVGDAETKYCGPTSGPNSTTWDNGIIADFTAIGYRLPTEVEWEYAARCGSALSTNKYSGTNSDDEIGNYAWYISNSNSKTHEVKTKIDNGIGLYDMSGNVFEWCWDRYADSLTSDTPTSGPSSGSGRVNRGGSILSNASLCSVVNRTHEDGNSVNPLKRGHSCGFRVVRTAE